MEIPPKVQKQLNNIPGVPGVYIYRNKIGKVLYVGKAKNLRNRVKSYFQANLNEGTKTKKLVSQIQDISYVEALSELEALILEAELIKRYKPRYNIALKDDKSYLYIVIRNEVVTKNGKKIKIPKVLGVRESDIKRGDIKFGPYPHARTARYILRRIRKVMPYRDCSVSKFQKYNKIDSPCLFGHIGMCSAPCTSEKDIKEYRNEINILKRFLSGDSKKIISKYQRAMKKSSKNQEYEKAAEYRDVLKKFNYIRQNFKSAEKYVENPYLVQDLVSQSLDDLVLNIPMLKKIPSRIECYDISNISGKEATGSMVVALDGRLANSEYRKFKIKLQDSPDDFGMMREVLSRRFKREKSKSKNIKKWGLPELLVVDGGKGQVSAALDILKIYNLKIPVIGLAKKFETIVFLDEQKESFVEINLEKTNEGLKLLQRLRDEAHRFARRYHHKLRLNKIEIE